MLSVPVAEQNARARTGPEQREFERAAVAEHYEHDPRIFSLVLDSGLAYSTGIYKEVGEDLETAARGAALAASRAVAQGLAELGAGEGPVDVFGLKGAA